MPDEFDLPDSKPLPVEASVEEVVPEPPAGTGVAPDSMELARTQTEPEGQGGDPGTEEVVASFNAFMKSLDQGRDLKHMRQELSRHRKALEQMRAVHTDNTHILEDYDRVTGMQQGIITDSRRLVEGARESIGKIESDIAALEAQLAQLREENVQAIKPESDELYQRGCALANAQSALKAAKAAAKDAAKADEPARAAAEAELEAAQQAYGLAKDAQRAAQKAYDDKSKQLKHAEKALEDETAHQQKRKEDEQRGGDCQYLSHSQLQI